MTKEIEYALMAGASYVSTRGIINQFPVPKGWVEVTNPPYFKDDSTGFETMPSPKVTKSSSPSPAPVEVATGYTATSLRYWACCPTNWNKRRFIICR